MRQYDRMKTSKFEMSGIKSRQYSKRKDATKINHSLGVKNKALILIRNLDKRNLSDNRV